MDDRVEKPLDRLFESGPALPSKIRELLENAINAPGKCDRNLRADVMLRAATLSMGSAAAEVPGEMKQYLDKVALWAYKVIDEELEALREAGHSDDEIFEITICAALGSGLARYQAGLIALEEELNCEDTV